MISQMAYINEVAMEPTSMRRPQTTKFEWSLLFGKHVFRNHSDHNVADTSAKINRRVMTWFGSLPCSIDQMWVSAPLLTALMQTIRW